MLNRRIGAALAADIDLETKLVLLALVLVEETDGDVYGPPTVEELGCGINMDTAAVESALDRLKATGLVYVEDTGDLVATVLEAERDR